jgi:hypothetical protein
VVKRVSKRLFRRLFSPNRHPQTRDEFRSLLALLSFPRLLLGFLALLVIAGALIGLGYWLTGDDGDDHSYWFWWRSSVLVLAGFATEATQENEWDGHALFQLAGAIGGVVMPALALGIVVFKAFVRDKVFVMRSRMALLKKTDIVERFPEAGTDELRFLAIRLYSSTKLQVVNVAFELYARVPSTSPTGAPIITNVRLRLYKDQWPVALPHVPYTLYSPIRAADLDPTGQKLEQVRAAGDSESQKLAPGCDLLLIATGKHPELGSEFVESHWFQADDLSDGRFGEIEVDSSDRKTWLRSESWRNWENFEN